MTVYRTREEILAAIAEARKGSRREVDIPELGGTVLVTGLSAKEWDAWQNAQKVFDDNGKQIGTDEENSTARFMVRCLINDDGTRLLSDQDADAFGDLPIAVVNKLNEVVNDLSGITDDAQKAIEGNSSGAPSGATSSESPETATEQPPES
jgi:hypothetical protein